MNIFIPEVQFIILRYVHNLFWKDVLIDYMLTKNQRNIDKADAYKREINDMSIEGRHYNPPVLHPMHKIIDKECYRQGLLDCGKYTLEQVNMLTRH